MTRSLHRMSRPLGPDDEAPSIQSPDAWGQFVISAVAGRGVPELLEAMWLHVRDTIAFEQIDVDQTYRP